MSTMEEFFGGCFDPSTVTPMDDFTPIPPGKYTCQIGGAEIKQTKAKTGHGLTFLLTVLDGSHKGRKVFDFINIDNPNPVAQEIARRVLAALVLAAGLQRLGPVAELNGKVVVAHVKVKSDQNNVRTYSSPGAVASPVVSQPGGVAAAPQAAPAAPPVYRQPAAQAPGTYPAAPAPTPATVSVAPYPAPVVSQPSAPNKPWNQGQ